MVIYEIKGNKEVCSFRKNERALCDNYANLNGTVSLENWKMSGSPHMEKELIIHQEETKYSSNSLQHLQ